MKYELELQENSKQNFRSSSQLIQTSEVSQRTWQHSLTKDRCVDKEPNIFYMLQHYLISEFINWNAKWLLDLTPKNKILCMQCTDFVPFDLAYYKHTIQGQVTWHFPFQYRLLRKRKRRKHTNSMLSCFCPVTLHTSYRAKYITHTSKTMLSMDYKTVISKKYVVFHACCITKWT
jgi:hypothetical protein